MLVYQRVNTKNCILFVLKRLLAAVRGTPQRRQRRFPRPQGRYSRSANPGRKVSAIFQVAKMVKYSLPIGVILVDSITKCMYIYIIYIIIIIIIINTILLLLIIIIIYNNISKCHMEQILFHSPAAFFFHSYASAQSISPAILRFALGCHNVTRT